MNNQDTIERLIGETPIRMTNLKKYFPYFEILRLNTTSIKYNEFDIGSIVLGILGYLLQEVEIRRKTITFTEICDFLNSYTHLMYNKVWDEESLKEFANYILNKLQNNGSPFSYEIYNFKKQKIDQQFIRYISYTYNYEQQKNHYAITSEGIDFYLQTKEFGDESKVTIHLLLLQKMINDNDYDSALTQIINVNTEVRKLIIRKKDVVDALLNNGIKAYYLLEEYKNSVSTRFDEEKMMFDSTKITVDNVYEEHIRNIDTDSMSQKEREVVIILNRIKEELKNTIEIHTILISETLGLNEQTDRILAEKRASAFKEKFNFQIFLQGVSVKDNIELLKNVIDPLLSPKIEKIFAEDKVEERELCEEKTIKQESNYAVNSDIGVKYETLDNMVEERLLSNYKVFFSHLFYYLTEVDDFTTKEFIGYIKNNHNARTVKNPDFHTFLSQLYSSVDGDIKDFPSKFHDLQKYSIEYGKSENKVNKENNEQHKRIEELMVEVLDDSDDFNLLKKSKIEICPKLEEYINVTDKSNITNYIIRRIES